jgi:O-antigen/teichoic acid export membrane protein
MMALFLIITLILSIIVGFYKSKNSTIKDMKITFSIQGCILIAGIFLLGLDNIYSYMDAVTIVFSLCIFLGMFIGYIIYHISKKTKTDNDPWGN